MSERIQRGPRGDYGQPTAKNAETQTDIAGVRGPLEDRTDRRNWSHPIFVPCGCKFDCPYWDPRYPYEGYVFRDHWSRK